MNYTRQIWSSDFDCTPIRVQLIGPMVLCSIFCMFPVAFYVALKIFTMKQRTRILKRKLPPLVILMHH